MGAKGSVHSACQGLCPSLRGGGCCVMRKDDTRERWRPGRRGCWEPSHACSGFRLCGAQLGPGLRAFGVWVSLASHRRACSLEPL